MATLRHIVESLFEASCFKSTAITPKCSQNPLKRPFRGIEAKSFRFLSYNVQSYP